MVQKLLPIGQQKRIALIAHDSADKLHPKKQDRVEWAKFNRGL